MTTPMNEYASYLLVDGALLGAEFQDLHQAELTSRWLHTIYLGEGASYGPLLIDVEAACEHEALEQMMRLVNGLFPQLHLSYIESSLPADRLILHLRQFRAIQTDDGRLLTLRFADNVALWSLATVLHPGQWKALLAPIRRWSVHGRGGDTRTLASGEALEPAAQPPLTLSAAQLADLDELCAPDVILANIRDIRHGEPLPGTIAEQHRWASASRHVWRQARNEDLLVLRWLTSAAIDTAGAILSTPALPTWLVNLDRTQIKIDMLAYVRAKTEHEIRSLEVSPVLCD